jgi:hypothetical protein
MLSREDGGKENYMKRTLVLALTVLLVFAIAACGGGMSKQNNLDDYLISVSMELANQSAHRANPIFLKIMRCPVEIFDFAASYSDLPSKPLSADIFSVDATSTDVLMMFYDESEADELISEMKSEWSKEQLVDFYENLSELAPTIPVQWINGWFTSRLTAGGVLRFSTEVLSHKDFKGTHCVMLNYEGNLGIWVVFTKSEISDTLQVSVIPTINLNEIRGYDDYLWEELDSMLDRMSSDRRHYDLH